MISKLLTLRSWETPTWTPSLWLVRRALGSTLGVWKL